MQSSQGFKAVSDDVGAKSNPTQAWALHHSPSNLAAALLALVALTGCAGQKGVERPLEDDYVVAPRTAAQSPLSQPIRPGDVLEINVLEDPALSGNLTVRAEGHVMMPSIGPRVQVAGMSVQAAEKHIKKLLEQKSLKTATVTLDRVTIAPVSALADKEQTLVYLTGKVAAPGQHLLASDIGVALGAYEAIMITGGLARFADGKKAHVLRPNPDGTKRKVALNLDAVASGRERDLPLRKGDIVVVPEKVFGF